MDFMLNFPMFASILLVFLIVVKVLWPQKGKSTNKRVPCPPAYPIIGHLHLMAQNPTDPWKTFDSFRQQYGDIVSLRLGMWNAVLISSFDVIKEVLLTRGDEFADRPTFHRYSIIFSGDRNNALALCDWSELQKIRRSVSQLTTMPNTLGCQHQKLVDSIDSEMKIFLDQLDGDSIVLTKSDALQYVTNVFTEYMCSVRFEYNDETLVKQAYNYDYVFYDINQCYLIDFLPFLRYFGVSRGYLNNLKNVCDDLRDFVAKEFIEPRVRVILESKKNDDNKRIGKESLSIDDSETFVDYIIKFHLENKDLMSWDHMLFVIGDLLGGSSAVANIIWRMLGNLALDMNVQEILYDEVERVYKSSQNDLITLEDRKQLAYLDAVFLEALRFASSPIVPHVPSQDSTIAGYDIPKGTMVMFNNYHLNNSTEFWESPEKFDPKHFLTQVTDQDGTLNYRVKKPDVFIPFSFGKRSCLGLKLTKYIAMITVANIILKYEVHPVNANDAKDMQDQLSQRMLALKVDDCYSLKLIPRES